MSNYYTDIGLKLDIVDISGNKTIEEINQEFNGNFIDITKQTKDKIQLLNSLFLGGLNGLNNQT